MIYNIHFELTAPKETESNLEFVTGDVGAYTVRVTCTENGQKKDISHCSFAILGKRADGKVFSDAGTVEGGVAVYTFRNDFYAVPGDLAVQFLLTDALGNCLTAKIVHIHVVEGLESGVSAQDTGSAFTVLLSQLTDRLNQTNTALEKAQALTYQLEEDISALEKDLGDALSAADAVISLEEAYIGGESA